MTHSETNAKETQSLLYQMPFWIIVATCAFLLVAYLFPSFEVNSSIVRAAYWVSETGSKKGLPVVILGLLVLLALWCDAETRKRWKYWGIVLLILIVFAGAGAKVNEHIIKPGFGVPRPDVVEMSKAGVLGMPIEEFYSLPDKDTRSQHLEKVLDEPAADKLKLPPFLKDHWIEETGFSFPSGHSLATMTVATFFVGLATGLLTGRRSQLFNFLLPWAVLVCWSRPVLHVHSPTDITIGGIGGAVVGSIAVAIALRNLRRANEPTSN